MGWPGAKVEAPGALQQPLAGDELHGPGRPRVAGTSVKVPPAAGWKVSVRLVSQLNLTGLVQGHSVGSAGLKLGQQSLGLLPAVQALGTEDLKPIVMDALNGSSGAASIIAVADAGAHLDIPGVGIVGKGILQDEDAVAHVLAWAFSTPESLSVWFI